MDKLDPLKKHINCRDTLIDTLKYYRI